MTYMNLLHGMAELYMLEAFYPYDWPETYDGYLRSLEIVGWVTL